MTMTRKQQHALLADLRQQHRKLTDRIRRGEELTRVDTTTVTTRAATDHDRDRQKIRTGALVTSQLEPYDLKPDDIAPVSWTHPTLPPRTRGIATRDESIAAYNIAKPVDRTYGYDHALTYLYPGEPLKLRLAQAINGYQVEGYRDAEGNWQHLGAPRKRANGTTYRPTLGYHPEHIGDPVFFDDYQSMAVTVAVSPKDCPEIDIDYYLIVARKQHLNGNNPAHAKLFARVNPGKILRPNSRRFIWHPEAYDQRTETPQATYPLPDLADVASAYVREVHLDTASSERAPDLYETMMIH